MNKYRLSSDLLFTRPEEERQIEPARIIFLSVEGNDTEQNYFDFVEKYRTRININYLIHIHALRRSKKDGKSAPRDILELLEEYIQLRQKDEIPDSLRKEIPNKYSDEFIIKYLNNEAIASPLIKDFETDLAIAGIDFAYNQFLRNYKGKNNNDVFGVVMDRDCGCHSVNQLKRILDICNEKDYKFYLTNPCFEFWLLLHISDVKIEYADKLNDFLENRKISKNHNFTTKELSKKSNHNKSISEQIFVNKYLPNIDKAMSRLKQGFQTNINKLIGTEKDDNNLHGELGTNLHELFELIRK